MHILFVHQNYPAQFGHVARILAGRPGTRCSFVSELPPGSHHGVELIQYRIQGGATARTHPFSRTFENQIWHSHALYDALRARPDIQPDLIVGHSGFTSTLFLRELYPSCPMINYFEYYYHTTNSDMDFRPDFPVDDASRLRARARNACLLLDLENCDAGYSPTHWQRSRLPARYQDKVRVIFDGIDTTLWKPEPDVPRHIAGIPLPTNIPVVSYATRGMESMRGFDIFMKTAKRIAALRPDVRFLIAGEDRVCYGGDAAFTGGKSFKQWVLDQDEYDLSRFHFLGILPPTELARLFHRTNLHIYLTVPFVLSWSLLNALACGATVLASATPPVQEIIQHGDHGLLAPFFDLDALASQALEVLANPAAFRHLGASGARLIRDQYSLDVCIPRMLQLYEEVLAR
jgi:glycosyltransferase involved in cell wall biosynthesis